MSQILEKLMHHRLTLFLENNNKFFRFQFGLRNNHSMTHNSITLTEQIRNASDNKSAFVVLTELQKAFDTVNYKLLLPKMEYYSICGLPLSWFQS